jgi:hypothetical protein
MGTRNLTIVKGLAKSMHNKSTCYMHLNSLKLRITWTSALSHMHNICDAAQYHIERPRSHNRLLRPLRQTRTGLVDVALFL